MSSSSEDVADVGLLSPVSAGTRAEQLTSDSAVVAAMQAFEIWLTEALAEHAPEAPGLSFDPSPVDVRAVALDAVGPGNPTLPLVAAMRRGLDEGDAGWVHLGATSQDLVDTALMLVSQKVLEHVEEQLVAVADRLAGLAAEHRDRPCAARTLTQQAVPTTLGFRVAGWLAGVHDALELVRGCRPLPVSLGGAVGTTAVYGAVGPGVVDSLARMLDLSAPVVSWHTRRTPVLRVAAALVAVGEACGRICADVLLMAQTEVGEASDGSGGASSAMAHKTNPTRSVLVAAAARQLPPLLGSVASSGAGASERPAGDWHAEWQPLRTMLRLAGAAAERTRVVVTDLSFSESALARNLQLLVAASGQDADWVETQTAHVGAWVDRVLSRHAEVVG